MTAPSIAEFFEDAEKGGGGGLEGAASFDFKGNVAEGIGLSVAGEIVDVYVSPITDIDPPHAVKTDKNGKVINQMKVTLQTDLRDWVGAKKPWTDKDGNAVEDTGLRSVYLRYQGARALAEAVKAADATPADVTKDTGAKLFVKRIENDGKMNQFEVKFKKGDRTPPPAGVEDFVSSAGEPAASAPSAESAWGDTSTSPASDEPPF